MGFGFLLCSFANCHQFQLYYCNQNILLLFFFLPNLPFDLRLFHSMSIWQGSLIIGQASHDHMISLSCFHYLSQLWFEDLDWFPLQTLSQHPVINTTPIPSSLQCQTLWNPVPALNISSVIYDGPCTGIRSETLLPYKPKVQH